MVKPIPDGYHTVTPFLMANDATALLVFIKKAFKGHITSMMQSDDGIVRHSTIQIGDSQVMVASASETYEAMPCMLHLYVDDVDAVYEQAIKAGGASIREPLNEFYGDRSAGVKDSCGNQWWIATHIEDVSDEEMKEREENFTRKKALQDAGE